MMKKILLVASLAGASFCANAQVSKSTDDLQKSLTISGKDTVCWVHSGVFTVGINEGFLHNWAAGGEIAALAVNSVFHGNLTHYHHNLVWSNNLDVAYGLNYAYSNGFVPRKTEDRVDFTSNFGTRIKNSKDFYFAGLFNVKSQFTKGYDYSMNGWERNPTSDLFSPTYLTLAAGIKYDKNDVFNLFFSPLAARDIMASSRYTSLSAAGAFGIDSGKNSKFQLGAYFSGRVKKKINKNLLFTTRLDLYSNYLAKDTKDASGLTVKRDNPGNVQIFWDNLFVLKAYKNLSLTFGLTLAYDNNFPYSSTYVDKVSGLVVNKDQPGGNLGWVQLNQVFTFGIAYKF